MISRRKVPAASLAVISEEYEDLFPRSVQERGWTYFENGAVRLTKVTPERIEATVFGSQLYRVELDPSAEDLAAGCTCIYFRDSGPCKHIWATLLAVELESHLPNAEPIGERPPKPPNWRQQIEAIRLASTRRPEATWSPEREIGYVVDVHGTLEGRGLVVEVAQRRKKANGEWTRLKVQKLPTAQLTGLPDPSDREILSVLLGGQRDMGWNYYESYGSYGSFGQLAPRFRLSGSLSRVVLPLLCATGRCRLRSPEDSADPPQLTWMGNPAWEFCLEVRPDADDYVLEGSLRRAGERRPLSAPSLLTAGGVVFFRGEAGLLDDGGAFHWIVALRQESAIRIPRGDADRLLRELFAQPRRLRVEWPEELRVEEVLSRPRPRLRVAPTGRYGRLPCQVSFDYDGTTVALREPGWAVFRAERRSVLLRDGAAEEAAYRKVREAGARPIRSADPGAPERLEIVPARLPGAVRKLLAEGWQVEAEGRVLRPAGEFRIRVNTGLDWFELTGSVPFGDREAPLPAVLAALKKRSTTVPLDDGTLGVLPEEWLRKYGLLSTLGKETQGSLRFSRGQAGLLDALLAGEPEVTVDERFRQARGRIARFEGVHPAKAPPGFQGKLRGYQEEGLGWLLFLQEFGLGGCLADDMGLGKTVQVLALLESRRELRQAARPDGGNGSGPSPRPSLVVVPKSLVFNWKEEAARFAPGLAILDHTGLERARDARCFESYDLVLTTYGTLRRDVLLFKDVPFDYAILDEAQAIKNPDSDSAKAARLLRAEHRLALSGTPVENHLSEIWSLFEFLNPGILGPASGFRAATSEASEENLAPLARGLRPLILRRKKEEVVKDLPPKTEQTISCQLAPAQRKLYGDLRDHYRHSLLGRVEREGIASTKLQVLEALLRLRQAACHPGLLDPRRAEEPGGKLEALLPQLTEVLEEEHKALVFSQFTRFLGILRTRLDRLRINYEYLDGKTRDRAARVRRFQKDPDCRLFLVSLKAGGVGLNLTAAEYVFLLDPWWNPAVEAQAVDRTHRIGQQNPVFAYRFIAQDTVEEKVLALQQTKRRLADAILGGDNSFIRNLKREDLELLLS
jgi:superfamily II DNA or RNA helicase